MANEKIKASLIVPISATAADEPLELVFDSRDDADSFPALYAAGTVPVVAEDSLTRHSTVYQCPLLRYGRAVARLYAADAAATVASLDPLTLSESIHTVVPLVCTTNGIQWVGAFSLSPSAWPGVQLQELDGPFASTEREVLTFSGEFKQRLRFWHSVNSPRILHATAFVGAAGQPLAPPTYQQAGWYGAEESLFGSLVVEYEAAYRKFHLYYECGEVSNEFNILYSKSTIAGQEVTQAKPDFKPIGREPFPLYVAVQSGKRIKLAQTSRAILPPIEVQPQVMTNPDESITEEDVWTVSEVVTGRSDQLSGTNCTLDANYATVLRIRKADGSTLLLDLGAV